MDANVVYCASKISNSSDHGKSSVTSSVDDTGVSTFEIGTNLGLASPHEFRESIRVPHHLMQEFLEQVTKAATESQSIVLNK